MIYSIGNYDVFGGNSLSYEKLLLTGKNMYDRIHNKMFNIFSKKVFNIAYFKSSIARAI